MLAIAHPLAAAADGVAVMDGGETHKAAAARTTGIDNP
jgi:hypothetical protein